MTGRIVYEVHRCVPPRILKRYGKGTRWLCECGKDWSIIFSWGNREWTTTDYAQAIEAYRQAKGFRKGNPPNWSYSEQRMVN
jgi:hypothetical protein